ncbi:FAD synthase [Patescibacteria group bacterium]|nr:FAD synthase [Patescibacteria group bacterium]
MSPPSSKTVLASGVFDIVHPGHLHFLSEARKLGDRLVVVVTSDEQAEREKRKPRHRATDRVTIIASLAPVDEAFVGAEPYDLVGTVKKADANVIALGYDQKFDEQRLVNELKTAGMNVAVVRCPELPRHATSDLLS